MCNTSIQCLVFTFWNGTKNIKPFLDILIFEMCLYIKQVSLLIQQKSSKLCIALESLQIPQLPPPLKCDPIFILVFSLARSNSFFLHCFSSPVFLLFSLTWAKVVHISAFLLLLSILRHCKRFVHESIWPGKSRHCVGEERCRVRAAWGKGAASSI